jgi:hypothetical protein
MKNGGSLSGLKASNKRVGATKMAKGGACMSKKEEIMNYGKAKKSGAPKKSSKGKSS